MVMAMMTNQKSFSNTVFNSVAVRRIDTKSHHVGYLTQFSLKYIIRTIHEVIIEMGSITFVSYKGPYPFFFFLISIGKRLTYIVNHGS